MRRLSILALCLSLISIACGNRNEPTSSPSPEGTSDPKAAASTPTRTLRAPSEAFPYTIQITTPDRDGAKVKGPDVFVSVTVQAFKIVDKLGEAAKEGEGHVHYYLDVEDIPQEQGEPAVTGDESTYHATVSTFHAWEDVESGEHTLGVQLVNNDHTPLDPPATDEIDIDVG